MTRRIPIATRATAVLGLVGLLLAPIAEVDARGRGGGGRGGGFSRQGPAAGGGFSDRSRSPSTRDAGSAGRSDRGAGAPSTRPSSPAGDARPPEGGRPPEPGWSPGTRPPDGNAPPVGDRPPPPRPIPPPPPPPPPGYYGGHWDYYDDDWAEAVVVGTMVTGVAIGLADEADDDEDTSISTTVVNTAAPAASASPTTFLPCEPQVVTFDDMAYYRCGSQYYVQAVSGSGTVYVPVSPPG